MNLKFALFGLIGMVLGCGTAPEAKHSWPMLSKFTLASSARFPDLAEVRRGAADPILIDRLGGIAVATSGTTAVMSATTGEFGVLLFAADGSPQAVISRPGQGPGEFSSPAVLHFADTVLHVFPTARPASIRFDAHGGLLDETRLHATSRGVMGLSDATIDAMHLGPGGFDGIAMERVGTEFSHPFLTTENSAVESASRDPNNPGFHLPPPYVRSGGFAIVGDGWTYKLAVFDTTGEQLGIFGRDLPTSPRGPRGLAVRRASLELAVREPLPGTEKLRARLDTLDRERVVHFLRGSLGVDGKGRLWVVGSFGDSTFADVFADTTFLGRHVLPCLQATGGASVNGAFLALRCLEPDEESYRLRLYRIVDPD